MFHEAYFSNGAARPSAGSMEEESEYDKYRSSADTYTNDVGRGSSSTPAAAENAIVPQDMISETPGYEGMPTEDAVVSSLASRRAAPNQLGGPREDFRRNSYSANGSGRLLAPSVSPSRELLTDGAERDPMATVGALVSPASENNRGGAGEPHKSTGADDDARRDGAIHEARDGLAVPELPLDHLESRKASRKPRDASAPPPSYTPRTGGRGDPATSRHRHVNPAASDAGSDGYNRARPSDYSRARSVIGEYVRGEITAIEAQFGPPPSSRAATPSRQTQNGVSRGTPRAYDLRRRTSSPAPQMPSSMRSATPQQQRTPGSAALGASPRGLGAPRCASIIPERMRYVPKPPPPPEPTPEELEEQERQAAAEAAAEEARQAKLRRDARVAARRVAERAGSPRPRARTPISYREGDAPEDRAAAKKGGRKKRGSRSVEAGKANGGSRGATKDTGLLSRTLYQPKDSATTAGGKASSRQTAKPRREMNPFAYRKKLVFPTQAPTVDEAAMHTAHDSTVVVKKHPSRTKS